MADTKITDLGALTGAGAAPTDVAVVVDVSDTSMAASGTDKKITLAELGAALGSVGGLATTAAVAAGYQPLDSDLTAIAALTTTSFGRALLTQADASATRSTLGLGTAAVVDTGTGGSNVPTVTQADARYQPLDSDLTAIAALTTTSFGRSILTQADASAARTTLGVAIGTNVQAYDSDLAAIAALTSAADKVAYCTGSGTWALTDLTSTARSLLDDASTSAMRTTLGVAIGSDVQAYDAQLADLAGISFSQGDIVYFNGTNLVRLAAGTNGQYLQTQGAGANPQWATVSGGGGSVATDSIFDAKGDLPVGTGSDTASKLTVGTNGQILAADSTQSTGVKWLTAPNSWANIGQYGVPGAACITVVTSATAKTADRIYYEPFSITAPITITKAMLWVTSTSAAGGSTARLGVCSVSSTFTSPTLVSDFGTIAIDSTGNKTITGLSVTLPPGLYALMYWPGAAISGVKYMRTTSQFVEVGGDFYATANYIATSTYAGSWPGTLPAPSVSADASTPGFWRSMYITWT